MLNDGGMHECVQSGAGGGIIEHDFAENLAVDGAVCSENVFTKSLHHGVENGRTGLKELVSDVVRVDQMATKLDKHQPNGALTCTNPTGEPDAKHLERSPHSCCFERVLHQHCDGHRPNSAGNRRQHGCDFLYATLINIAGPDITAFFEVLRSRRIVTEQPLNLGTVRNLVGADIDDDSTGLNPVTGNHRRPADCGHDDIGAANNVAKITRF